MTAVTLHLRASRRGLTLMELMLVLALLVVISSITVIALQATLTNQQLRKAGDQVRAQMGRARVRAMKSGRTHVLIADQGANEYSIEPWITGDESVEANAGSLQTGAAGTVLIDSSLLMTKETLPEGVVIYGVESVLDNRAILTESTGSTVSGKGSQLPPIFFYADGTTSPARMTLTNSTGLYVVVTLRGLTGAAQTSDALTLQELSYQQ